MSHSGVIDLPCPSFIYWGLSKPIVAVRQLVNYGADIHELVDY